MYVGTADFYALNHYSSRLVTRGSDSNPNFNPDAEYVTSVDDSWPKSPVAPWLIVTNYHSICKMYTTKACVLGGTRWIKTTFGMVKK